MSPRFHLNGRPEALIGMIGCCLIFALSMVHSFCFAQDIPPKSFIHPADNAQMILIPAGPFIMGSNSGWQMESPEHSADLPVFYIDKYEVTIDQYKKFVDSGAYRNAAHWETEEAKSFLDRSGGIPLEWEELLKLDGQTAMGNVSFYEAWAYCKWAGKSLPTAAQWEKAARGSDGRKYPWGNDWLPANANIKSSGEPLEGNGGISAWPGLVSGYPQGKSPYGVEQMSGNVWEWTRDEYKPYPGNENPHLFYPPVIREMRGGSWNLDERFSTTSFRNFNEESRRKRTFGLRCVCETPPPPAFSEEPDD